MHIDDGGGMARAAVSAGAHQGGPLLGGRWATVAVVSAGQLMLALDATVMNVALPSAERDLGFSVAERQWMITAYTLAFGSLLLVGGRVADSVDRRRLLQVGAVGFAVASAVAGAATGLPMLAAGRAAQGVCAAMMAPALMAVLSSTFTDGKQRGQAFAVFGAIASAGGAIGLVLGGVLTQGLSWRWCAYLNVFLAVAFGLAAQVAVPKGGGSRGLRRLDIVGAVLATVGIAAVLVGCSAAASHGWTTPRVGVLLTAGAVALTGFVWWEARTTDPVLPLGLLADRLRAGCCLAVAVVVAALLTLSLFVTYYLQQVREYSALHAGVAFLPLSAAVLISSQLAGRSALARGRPGAIIVPGLLLCAAAMVWLSRVTVSDAYLSTVLPSQVLLGLGAGCVLVPAISAATSGVDGSRAGVVSGILTSAQQLGGTLGLAVLNTIAAQATVAYLRSHHSAQAAHEAIIHADRLAALAAGGALILAAALVALLTLGRTTPAASQ